MQKHILILGVKRIDNTVNGAARYEVTYFDQNDVLTLAKTKPGCSMIDSDFARHVAPEYWRDKNVFTSIIAEIDGQGRIGNFKVTGKHERQIGRLAGVWS